MSADADPPTPPPVTPAGLTGWLPVLVVAGAAAGGVLWLWADSLPGGSLLHFVGTFWLWSAAGIGWLALVVTHVRDRLRHRPPRPLRGAVVAAMIVAGAIGLGVVDAPLRARWALSQSAFATVADAAQPGLGPLERAPVPTPDRLGAYRVADAYQLGDAVFIRTRGGGGLLSADGFAFLPDGPTAGLEDQYEGTAFRSIGGDWYAWSASV